MYMKWLAYGTTRMQEFRSDLATLCWNHMLDRAGGLYIIPISGNDLFDGANSPLCNHGRR